MGRLLSPDYYGGLSRPGRPEWEWLRSSLILCIDSVSSPPIDKISGVSSVQQRPENNLWARAHQYGPAMYFHNNTNPNAFSSYHNWTFNASHAAVIDTHDDWTIAFGISKLGGQTNYLELVQIVQLFGVEHKIGYNPATRGVHYQFETQGILTGFCDPLAFQNMPATIIVTSRSADNSNEIYSCGMKIASRSSGGGIKLVYAGNWRIGSKPGVKQGFAWGGMIGPFVACNMAWSDEQARQFNSDPYGFLRPRNNIFPRHIPYIPPVPEVGAITCPHFTAAEDQAVTMLAIDSAATRARMRARASVTLSPTDARAVKVKFEQSPATSIKVEDIC